MLFRSMERSKELSSVAAQVEDLALIAKPVQVAEELAADEALSTSRKANHCQEELDSTLWLCPKRVCFKRVEAGGAGSFVVLPTLRTRRVGSSDDFFHSRQKEMVPQVLLLSSVPSVQIWALKLHPSTYSSMRTAQKRGGKSVPREEVTSMQLLMFPFMSRICS